jgi:alkanesulfonate monooxygenase SsuD/methylene tetrahydromethanopterin reductase-like flavin-dependent oxidoreductase (luciferase family)
LPAPIEGYDDRLDPVAQTMLDQALACSVVGDPDQVHAGIEAFAARTGADELIVTAQSHDPAARLRSFEIAARSIAA